MLLTTGFILLRVLPIVDCVVKRMWINANMLNVTFVTTASIPYRNELVHALQ